jgi:cleavage and polyadenylation specificity factor subunit 1
MYTTYSELMPSSSVEFAVVCNFVSLNNLVVAKGNLLQIFNIISSHQTLLSSEPLIENDALSLPGAKLLLLHEFTLSGDIRSIQTISLATSRFNCLVLAFKDAKVSIVEYCQETHSLLTISIHLYEREEFRVSNFLNKAECQMNRDDPVVRVDPQSRLCVTSFYKDYFSILPFQQGLGEEFSYILIISKQPFISSYVIKGSEIASDIKNVVDFTFLFGYLEPTLAILFESNQTWIGRLGSAKDTFSVIVVSVDSTQKMFPVLYRVDGLPYNCTHLKPVPKPLGGILVFSHNALIYMDQATTPGILCSLNAYFDAETRLRSMPSTDENILPPVKQKPPSMYFTTGQICDMNHLAISLDSATSVFLSPDILLITLRNGKMYQVDLVGDAGIGRSWKRRRAGIKKFELKPIGMRMMHASTMVNMPSLSGIWEDSGNKYRYGFFFAASLVADCLLVQYIECEEEGKDEGLQMDIDDFDAELYGGSKNIVEDNSDVPAIRFRVCDSLLVTGPIRDMTVGQPTHYSSHPYQGDSTCLEVVACTGDGIDGALTIFHNSVLPQILSSFEVVLV